LSDERQLWSMRIDETNDRAGLIVLDAALVALDRPWARVMRLKVGARLAEMKRSAAAPAGGGLVHAAAYGLPPADGRWLYAYRLEDAAFTKLQHDLSQRGRVEALETGNYPALFVLWASEWFRRCYRGGGQRWADLVAVLGMVEDQGRLRAITAAGLRRWGRPVIAAASAREYLGSLAREGGFPTAAIDEGGGGWALDVLKAIVAPLLAETGAGEERALALAATQRARLPQLFRDDEFIALCADLALAIVTLRRVADDPAARAGLPVIAWLALHRPGWRETLPLTTSERAAEALIHRLMKVEAVSGAGVGVERLLVHKGSGWIEAVRITLDGVVDSATMRAIDPAEGRLRAFAAGEMARSLPGEMAMFDPPADGEIQWSARATRAAKGIRPLPFAAAVEVDLRAGQHRVARIALTGGKARRGTLLVAVLDDEPGSGSADSPAVLRVIGAGSGLYRAQMLYLHLPAEWRVDATAGEVITPLGQGVETGQLWRIEGGAFVTDPAGDRFRVRCGQPGDVTNRIDLVGTAPSWAEVSGDVDLFAGAPIARTNRPEGELCMRAIGSRDWRRAPSQLPIGHYELGWRVDRVLLDRRRIAVIPSGSSVAQVGSAQRPAYVLDGLGSCSVRPAADAPVVSVEDGRCWQAHQTDRAVHWFGAAIEWPGAPSLPIRIAHPCPAAIARWDGRVLPDRTWVTLDQLSELVAVNRGRVQLFGELAQDGNRRAAEMTWQVVDELPMASIAGDIASLLMPASIDAEVRLGMHDGIETYWHVRQFAVELQRIGDDAEGGIVARRGIVAEEATLVGRALAAPVEEVSFGAYSLLTEANQRPVKLPDGLAGDWLIYLRAGDKVMSRPLFHRGQALGTLPADALARAMTNPPGVLLDAALLDLLSDAAVGGSGAPTMLDALLALITSLRGLPPATFRVLALLTQRPKVLAQLAFLATPDQRDAVMALSDALPFAWCTITRQCWDDAQRFSFERNMLVLETLGSDAPRYAMEAVASVRAALIAREPLLGPVLAPGATQPIDAVAQAFLNRAADRVTRAHQSRYRAHLGDALPRYFTRFDEGVVETLDAPCAAALAVNGAWTPRAGDIRHIKTVARTFPTYFADAFAAALKEPA
jgi:hypothetical protein